MGVTELPTSPPGRRPPTARAHIHELLATSAAVDKLGARGISTQEAEQLLHNRHAVIRNRRGVTSGADRRLLIGLTDGGRALTVVVEATVDPTTWLIVTAWPATAAERNILGD